MFELHVSASDGWAVLAAVVLLALLVVLLRCPPEAVLKTARWWLRQKK
ncbi:hypothetical protein ACIOWI_14565 [Streptomyces sp. NPDC087659]